MNLDWQNNFVLVIVAAAALYVVRLVWQTLAQKKSGACGQCGSCPANNSAADRQLVELASFGPHAKQSVAERSL